MSWVMSEHLEGGFERLENMVRIGRSLMLK